MQIVCGLNNDVNKIEGLLENKVYSCEKYYNLKVKMKSKAVSDNLAESSSAYFHGHYGMSMHRFPFLNQTLTISSAS